VAEGVKPAAAPPAVIPIDKMTSEQRSSWRLTGEFPTEEKKAAEPKKEDSSDKTEKAESSPAQAESESPVKAEEVPESATGAESDAQDVEKTSSAKKNANNRVLELLGETKKLNSDVQRLERELAEAKKSTAPVAELKQPEKPTPDSFDSPEKYGEAYEKWQEQMAEFRDKALTAKIKADFAKEAQEAKINEMRKKLQDNWSARTAAAQEKYKDFDTVALKNDKLVNAIPQGSVIDSYILNRAGGTDVLYHLGKNPADLAALLTMSPIDQAYRLAEIELTLEGKTTPAPKQISNAPAPLKTVDSGKQEPTDTVERAIINRDVGAYMREANARAVGKR